MVKVLLYLLAGLALPLAGLALAAWRCLIWMPGHRWHGHGRELREDERPVRERLERDLRVLAQDIGERNLSRRYAQLADAASFIEQSLREAGYEPVREEFQVNDRPVWNVLAQCLGSEFPQSVVIVGAHYDTVPGSPGANDNGSAVVAKLALARAFATRQPQRTLRFAFFVNEEWPYYMTEAMGSWRHARACRSRGESVHGMLSLETIGCCFDGPRTQRYPQPWLGWLYPTTGNFAAVVGNVRSRRLVRDVVRGLRRVPLRSEGIAAPNFLKDIFRSDHAAFWALGYPALMVTDTANFRYRHYHTAEDTVDKINFDFLTRLVSGLVESLRDISITPWRSTGELQGEGSGEFGGPETGTRP